MEPNGFARVRSLLRYTRPARWTAILTGVASALLFALLTLLLALFVDLLVTRGRIPNYSQLSVRDQESALDEWASLSREDRERALQQVGFGDLIAGAEPSNVILENPARRRMFHSLAEGSRDSAAPVPGRSTAEDYRVWATKNRVA